MSKEMTVAYFKPLTEGGALERMTDPYQKSGPPEYGPFRCIQITLRHKPYDL